MDDLLKKALDFSNYNQTLNVQKRIAREKLDLNLTFGINGGLFKIDKSLIVFVQLLIEKGRTADMVLLDHHNNPILINDLIEFYDTIFDRYNFGISEYYQEIEQIKKSRSVERLANL